MDRSPENLEIQPDIMKAHFKAWSAVFREKAIDYGLDRKKYAFTTDRRNDEYSLVTADKVLIDEIREPLEEYTDEFPSNFKSYKGERWLTIEINPKDPYRPKIAKLTLHGDFYYTEALTMYLSNRGRAFQVTEWRQILEPDIDRVQHPSWSYLKAYPNEDVTIIEKEPELASERIIEPTGPLNGQNFERLNYMLDQVRKGNTIDEK
ncbi:MAG: hypothetical protein Q8P25_03230 [Candidatus Curtissbacteria bacterium]|nr:hypothetical protein [Candidatus Curtissbacteria bacterium]